MDFKKFGLFIIIIGALTIIYGLYLITANQPLKQRQVTSLFDLSGMSKNFEIMDINNRRKVHRNNAPKFMIAGGVVLILGIGMSVSAKGKRISGADADEDH